ncbi:fic doc family [Diplogelasinospora grovesii]|uniref:Fic doc family n=1 Tax=Diplogelasinospora grovesii TaxID=303347 RepID=A0AAN6NIQ5_9PEZI|nr:fic doc family [Diplogelasinospora grovesii]
MSSRVFARSLSSAAKERRDLLLEIYAPFANLDATSSEYKELARTECSSILREIDHVRKCMKRPIGSMAKQLVAEYAHQSLQIEDNHLSRGVSYKIYKPLAASFFCSVDMPSLSLCDLAGGGLPDVPGRSLEADKGQTVELRNLRLGQHRNAPIAVKSNPLRIFPCHLEVLACMRCFFQWREKAHQEKKIHPLILACQITPYFLHIHPFRRDYLRMVRDAKDGKPDELSTGFL